MFRQRERGKVRERKGEMGRKRSIKGGVHIKMGDRET
jgi:hypothetical protein